MKAHRCLFTLALTLLIAVNVAARAAEVTANIGWSSEYIFRGVPQSNSTASAGADVAYSGLRFGTWLADLGRGLEADIYAGFDGELADFSYTVGATLYTYPGGFDDDYLELNLAGGYGPLRADVAVGRYDNFAGPELDYVYYTVALLHLGFYASVSQWAEDYEGAAFEAGYSQALSFGDGNLVDVKVAAIDSNGVGARSSATKTNDSSLVLQISKTFGKK